AGLFTTLGRFRFASDTKAVVELTVKGADGHVIVDAVQFLAVDAKTGELVEQKVREVANTPEIEKLTKLAAKYEKQLKNLAKSAPEPAPVAMCVREEEEVGDFHICIRGDVHNLGERVPRGFLQVVDVPTEPVTSDQSG